MSNVIACRLASYGDYQERAWTHLPEIGIRFVELPAPALTQVSAVKQRLKDHGLVASSVQSRCDIAQADAVDVMKPQLETCPEFGAKICFLSVKAGDADRNQVFDRLRAIGEISAKLDITVVLETHPDMAMNAAQALETMKAINHPSVRINFDTANIYFYNQNTSAQAELEKIIDYVSAVHLKDTTGGYQEWNFPALGTGVVDFPQIIGRLNYKGFRGPFTMELEGTKGVQRTEAEQLKYIEESVAYLKRIAAFGGEA